MLTIATQVTTVVALVAFVSALIVIAYRSKLTHELEVVKNADSPEKIRTIRSLRGLIIDLDAGKLSGAQTLELAKAQLALSASTSTKVLIGLVALALILAATSVILYSRDNDESRPTLSELRELLGDPAPEQRIQGIVANWGTPSRIIEPGPIMENAAWRESTDDNFDPIFSERRVLVDEGAYHVAVYFVEDTADLYVVYVGTKIVAIGLGLRRLTDLPLLGSVSLSFNGEASTYSQVSESEFRFEACVGRYQFRDYDDYWGVGYDNYDALKQSNDQVHFYSCSFKVAFGKGSLFHFIFREKDVCENWKTGESYYSHAGENFECVEADPRKYGSHPLASVVFFGLKERDDEAPTMQAAISYIIGTFASPRFS